MSENERKYFSRSENTQRQRQNKKLDRILNYLIAIVIVLICLSSYFIFFNKDKEEAQDSHEIEQNDPVENDDTNQSQTANTSTENKQQVEGKNEDTEDTEDTNVIDESSSAVVTTSNDPLVDEVIVDPNWQPTPTVQTEPHTSVFADGHIDYEEKLATIYAVTSLSAENSILWNIKNNGSADTAIAVISSKDKELKYRVSIEWVKEQGWKPVKVEKLNTTEGTF
ncbi:YrrS family protein [Solibacillus sp. CAU 1738]|uniref:YrrS family protein n=1 Tax=Solibacillus sp. CAU 1738 TaxID=3140363 RepID=UPI0032614953